MLRARSAGWWTARFEIDLDGVPITTWTDGGWGGHGGFDLDGRRFTIRSSAWSGHYRLEVPSLEGGVEQLAETDRPATRRWSVRADGIELHFHRPVLGGGENHLMLGEQQVGHVRRAGLLDPTLHAELPDVPMHLQVFVIVVVGLVERKRRRSSSG